MSEDNDGNTAVLQITREIPRGDKKTVESKPIPEDSGPRSCAADECFGASYVSNKLAPEVLLEFFAADGVNKALLAYEARDKAWLEFLELGEGKAVFRFAAKEMSAALALAMVQEANTVDFTRVMISVLLFLGPGEKKRRTPFWLILDKVHFDDLRQIYEFTASLQVRNDLFDFSKDYPWNLRAKGKYVLGKEQGELQVIGGR